jgi:hypothetical protein
MLQTLRQFVVLTQFMVVAGCSNVPFELVPVSGSVKYADGTIPAGEVRVVRFEPVANAEGNVAPRAAAAFLEPDGTFQLMTMRPRDGAIPGDYKVALLFWKSPATRESTIPPAYGKAKTTPLPTLSVKSNGRNHFDLIVEKHL